MVSVSPEKLLTSEEQQTVLCFWRSRNHVKWALTNALVYINEILMSIKLDYLVRNLPHKGLFALED